MKTINVCVGVVFNENNEILIVQRPHNKEFPGFWEFPGGKIEATESPIAALCRELLEEINIKILSATHVLSVFYQYATKRIHLHVHISRQFSGNIRLMENQLDFCWVKKSQLANYSFPEANHSIIDYIISI